MNMNLIFMFVLVALSARNLAEAVEGLTKEEECFSQEKVYYEATDKCYKLLTRGPCPENEWLVLEKWSEKILNDSEIKITPVCVKEKCKNRELYWSANNTCFRLTEQSIIALCGTSSNEKLASNVFGEAVCTCKMNPPSARLGGDKKNPCYILYTQGPCPKGKIFAFQDESSVESREAECIDDPCYRDKTARPGTRPKTTNLAPWVDGKCYELGTRGPCDETAIFRVHRDLKKPVCSHFFPIFNRDSINCFTNENGVCQERIPLLPKEIGRRFENELNGNINA